MGGLLSCVWVTPCFILLTFGLAIKHLIFRSLQVGTATIWKTPPGLLSCPGPETDRHLLSSGWLWLSSIWKPKRKIRRLNFRPSGCGIRPMATDRPVFPCRNVTKLGTDNSGNVNTRICTGWAWNSATRTGNPRKRAFLTRVLMGCSQEYPGRVSTRKELSVSLSLSLRENPRKSVSKSGRKTRFDLAFNNSYKN